MKIKLKTNQTAEWLISHTVCETDYLASYEIMHIILKCSNCKGEIDILEENKNKPVYQYCPHCGKKMKSTQMPEKRFYK